MKKYKIKPEIDSLDGSIDYWVMVRKCFIWWSIHPYSLKIDAEEAIRKLEYGER